MTNVGRKGSLAFADLTALASPFPTSTLSQTLINNHSWLAKLCHDAAERQFFPDRHCYFQDNTTATRKMHGELICWTSVIHRTLTPCPSFPFTTVDSSTQGRRTDQAVIARQQLLKLQSSLNFSQNALQYMGTFSRERNQPARDWNRLNNRLPDRYDLGTLGMVTPCPAGTWIPRGRGNGHRTAVALKGAVIISVTLGLFATGLGWFGYLQMQALQTLTTLTIGVIGCTLVPRVCLTIRTRISPF